jgi:hypothetical protein
MKTETVSKSKGWTEREGGRERGGKRSYHRAIF